MLLRNLNVVENLDDDADYQVYHIDDDDDDDDDNNNDDDDDDNLSVMLVP